ncbi:MAG: hypothetical protein ACPGU1_23175 [Myxococcota bacterium]
MNSSAGSEKLKALTMFVAVCVSSATLSGWVALLCMVACGGFCIRAGLADRDEVLAQQSHPMTSYYDKRRRDLGWVALGVALIGASIALAWEFRHTFPL